jgi:glycosyltransferase involved in cell wall biosynthesis
MKDGTQNQIYQRTRGWNQFDRTSGRVLILVTTLTFGGAETQVVRLATELKARGWAVAVVCLVAPVAYVQQLNKRGIDVHSLDMPRGVPDFRAVFRLRSLIRRLQPEILHCHMFHANILGRIVRLFCQIPTLICTAHNLRETSEKGGPTWHKEALYRMTDCLTDKTTIICKAAFDRYVRVGAVPVKKLQMIPNGIDTEIFSPSDERRRAARRLLGIEATFVWLAVGRLVKQKDYPNLFRALQQLHRDDYILLIAGNGPLEGELRAECTQRGLDGRVRFVGTSEDIVDLYNAADAFVMSSEFEGLSAALLEASAMGLPSVVTNVGGNSEVVADKVTGYLVQPGNPDQLSVAMKTLMDASPERRQVLSSAARRSCCENYRFESIADRWVALYMHYLPATSFHQVSDVDVVA